VLTNPGDIWKILVKKEDVEAGVDYGIISRAWTYDRMGVQAQGGLTKAVFRIAVGKGIQHAFERIMKEKFGVQFIRDTHDYKEEDYWDIRTKSGKSFDVKSFHVFTDYAVPQRPRLTKSLIFNSSEGDNWTTFFPMLIPVDQFESEEPKDYYVFAILEAPSSKGFPAYVGSAEYLVAIPSSRTDPELNARYQKIHRRRFATERINEGITFSMDIKRIGQLALIPRAAEVTIGYGDAKGRAKRQDFKLQVGGHKTLRGLTAFHFLRLYSPPGVRENAPLFRLTFRDADEEGDIMWDVYPDSFRDVWVHDAVAYVIGWISRDDFDKIRRTYKAYGPRKDWQGNTNRRDVSARGILSRRSFCYFYPPTFHGGLQSHNYYCLPRDLNRMSSISRLLR